MYLYVQQLELTASVVERNNKHICAQEHRYYHKELELKYHVTSNGWTFLSYFLCNYCSLSFEYFKTQLDFFETQKKILILLLKDTDTDTMYHMLTCDVM